MASRDKKVNAALFLYAVSAATIAFLACVLFFANMPVYAGQRVDAPLSQLGAYLDRFEPNDTAAQNKLVAESSPVISLTFYTTATSATYNDPDWYGFNVNASTVLNVAAISDGSLILYARAYQSDGVTAIGIYTDVVGSSTIVLTNTSSTIQKYLIQVTNGTTENALYRLTYSSAAVPPPPDTGLSPDLYEPNDTIAEANIPTSTRSTPSFILVDTAITGLSFVPYAGHTVDEADWFEMYGRAGSVYQITTSDVRPGVETTLAVYQPVFDAENPSLVLVSPLPGSSNPNNRYQVGKRGSRVIFQVPSGADGMYWLRVTNSDPSPRIAGQTYTLSAEELVPSVQPRVFLPVVRRSL